MISNKQDDKAIKAAEQLASEAVDSSQARIDLIQGQRRDLLLSNVEELRKWRNVLATVSFSLAAAIAPLLLLTRPDVVISSYVTAGFILLLTNGALLSYHTKTNVEKENAELSTLGMDLEIQYLEKKKTALMWYKDIRNRAKYDEFIKTEDKIAQAGAEHQPNKQKIDYLNDLGIGLLVFAIYLISHDLVKNDALYKVGLIIIPLAFVVGALTSGKDAKRAAQKVTWYLGEHKRHAKEWKDYIDKTQSKT
jgi:hypothetical protein